MPSDISGHIRKIMDGNQPGPYHIVLGLTSRCNLNCKMCTKELYGEISSGSDPAMVSAFLDALEIPGHIQKEIIGLYPALHRAAGLSKRFKPHQSPKGALGQLKDELSGIDGAGLPRAAAEAVRDFRDFLYCWFTEEMPPGRMLELVDEAADMGVAVFSIAGIGEPLTDWQTATMLVRKIKERGMAANITTNATLLTEEIARELVDLDLDCLSVSMEGASPQTNDQLRGAGSYDAAFRGIDMFNDARFKTENGRPALEITVVLNSKNIMEAHHLINTGWDCGADAVNFMPVMIHTKSQAHLAPEGTPEETDSLLRAAKLARDIGIRTNAGALASLGPPYYTEMYDSIKGEKRWPHLIRGIIGSFEGEDYRHPDKGSLENIPCFEPWLEMIIDLNGRVTPCCRTYFSNMNLNVRDTPLKDAWLSGEMNYFRRAMLGGSLPPECRASCHPLLGVQADWVRNMAREDEKQ